MRTSGTYQPGSHLMFVPLYHFMLSSLLITKKVELDLNCLVCSDFSVLEESAPYLQGVIEVTREPSITFIIAKFDGILGLDFKTFLLEMLHMSGTMWWGQDLVKEPVFSFWFKRDADDKKGGELVFGGVDPKHFKSIHTYVPLIQKGY